MTIKIIAVIALLSLAGRAVAQHSASATGTASATIIVPMSITVVNGMEFGEWDSQEGTNVTDEVKIAPDATGGAGTITTSEVFLAPQSLPPTQANFTVTGNSSIGFNVEHAVSAVSGIPSGGTLTIMNSLGESLTLANGQSGTDNSKSVAPGWHSPMYIGVGMDLVFPGVHGKTGIIATINEIVNYD